VIRRKVTVSFDGGLMMISGLFGFEGRLGRGMWWLGQTAIIAILVLAIALTYAMYRPDQKPTTLSAFGMIGLLIGGFVLCVVINLCSTVKRFHDRGKSGWWFLMNFAPFIGAPWILIECGMLPGDDGGNEYGPPPGTEKRLASLNQEIAGIAASSSKLGRVDDEYLVNYAQKMTAQQSGQQTASASSFGSGGSARPAFGKR
jgi:uncharacterized membrane protein YhaH (DUF805 family)